MATGPLISAEEGYWYPDRTFRAAFGVDPLDWQRPYLLETRDATVLKGRQVGCSTAGGGKAIRVTRFIPDFLTVIVSPTMKQSIEVLRRCREGLERIGEPLTRDSETTIGLRNGSRIVSLPGSASSVRGWSAGLLIIDEAAFLDPDTFLACRAVVAATGGQTIVQSTPQAPFGPFYDLWAAGADAPAYLPGTTAPDPTVRWVRYHVSSEDVPTISKDFLASEREKLDPADYDTEYRGIFRAPGLGLLDPDRLRDLTDPSAPPEEADSSPWARIRP